MCGRLALLRRKLETDGAQRAWRAPLGATERCYPGLVWRTTAAEGEGGAEVTEAARQGGQASALHASGEGPNLRTQPHA